MSMSAYAHRVLPGGVAAAPLAASVLLIAACGPTAPTDRGTTTLVDFEVTEGTQLAFDVSPDGRRIVLDLLGQLWLLPIEGGQALPLTDAVRDAADDSDPAFSPNGSWVAFQGNRPGGDGVWIMSVEGGSPRLVTPPGRGPSGATHHAWSPDGAKIAYIARRRGELRPVPISLVEVETGRVSPVPVEPLPGIRAGVPEGTLTWSPAGDRIAFGTGTDAYNTFLAASPAGRSARVWEVSAEGGPATAISADGVTATAPSFAPDGSGLAYFALDPSGAWQLWLRSGRDGSVRKLTDHEDMAIRRVRWTPDSRSLIYSADGRLWRIDADGRDARQIPFTARVRFERERLEREPVSFAEPGSEQPARGFYGLAISRDGTRIAMLALGRLWVWPVGGDPEAVGPVPEGASHLSWSSDGSEVVFTTGDLHVMDVRTGSTRPLTALPGLESLPSWSPDGRHIAFEYDGTVRVVPAAAAAIDDVAQTTEVPGLPRSRGDIPLNEAMPPVWAPDSRGLLLYTNYWSHSDATLVSLDGDARQLDGFPQGPTFLHWTSSDAVVYAHQNRLWRADFDPDSGLVGDPIALTEGLASHVSVSSEGTVLFVSETGLRTLSSDGRTVELGWPLTYRVPEAAPSLLVRNARIIDGTGVAPGGLSDILVEGGRISRIEEAGTLDLRGIEEALDAEGRTVIPGLIDTHVHFDVSPPVEGLLYYGVTTVRDLGSPLAWTAARRDMVSAGTSSGPRIIPSLRFASGPGVAESMTHWMSDADAIARGMELAEAFGAGSIKFYDEDTPVGVTVVREALRRGLATTGHCSFPLALVAAGVHGQEHVLGCPREANGVYADHTTLKRAARMPNEVNFTFGGAFQVRLADEPDLLDRRDMDAFYGAWRLDAEVERAGRLRPRFEDAVARRVDGAARLHQAGVVVVAGTDHRFPAGMHSELIYLVEAGMTPLEAISAATSVAARVVGSDRDVGTIERGKLADLVLLDGNPLDDVRNVQDIWHVVLGGRVIDRDALVERARRTDRPGWFWLGH